tara:strand:+ start:38266 stop:38502 length:237 start_codon:yes stop_codon:yes gene_type:complete
MTRTGRASRLEEREVGGRSWMAVGEAGRRWMAWEGRACMRGRRASRMAVEEGEGRACTMAQPAWKKVEEVAEEASWLA